MTIFKDNYILFTGGPGAGKTAVLEELHQRGHFVVPEVARDIIKAQKANGGDATHDGDRKKYCALMLEKSIADFLQQDTQDAPIFFDRGIPDLFSYSTRFCGGVTSEILQATQEYRYHPTAFLFPAWPEIYRHDSERKQSLQEAIDTYHAVKQGYTACEYRLIEMPLDTIAARVDFILANLT